MIKGEKWKFCEKILKIYFFGIVLYGISRFHSVFQCLNFWFKLWTTLINCNRFYRSNHILNTTSLSTASGSGLWVEYLNIFSKTEYLKRSYGNFKNNNCWIKEINYYNVTWFRCKHFSLFSIFLSCKNWRIFSKGPKMTSTKSSRSVIVKNLAIQINTTLTVCMWFL